MMSDDTEFPFGMFHFHPGSRAGQRLATKWTLGCLNYLQFFSERGKPSLHFRCRFLRQFRSLRETAPAVNLVMKKLPTLSPTFLFGAASALPADASVFKSTPGR
jgi:hypothetical protein